MQPLEWGAVQLVPRDSLTIEQILEDLENAIELTRSVQVVELLKGSFPLSGAFPSSEVFDLRRALQNVSPQDKVVVISAGVGGPMSMRRILAEIGGTTVSPIVFLQRMAPALLDAVATWLGQNSSLEVVRATHGAVLQVGHVYVASSVCESIRIDNREQPQLQMAPESTVDNHVDVLLRSAAQVYGSRTVAVLLSGAGEDGCGGLRAVRDAGGFTMVQDRASSMIYDIPCRARDAGSAIECLPINEIAERIQMLMRLDHASSS
jgi:two-component system chemotaxis response regulator CheB